MTIFGPDWGDLTLDDVAAFLSDAEAEPLLWEAKGTRLDPHEVRRQVCGFANSHEGGYLILGAKRADDRWQLDPLAFPDEPAPWVGRTVREGGVRPVPDIDTLAWPAGGGDRQVAVVKVDPFAARPCNSRGTVYERVSGETIAVRDPQRLADLFARGDNARRSAELAARRAAGSAMLAGTRREGYSAEHVQFALGLACVGRSPDISARLFTPAFEERALDAAGTLSAHGPFTPIVGAEWSQTSLAATGVTTGLMERDAVVLGRWDGGAAVFERVATEATVVRSLVDRVSLAWEIAVELQRLLGGFGDAYLAVLVMPAGIHAQQTDSTSQYVHVTRGPMVLDVPADQLASIRRELERASGESAYETGEPDD